MTDHIAFDWGNVLSDYELIWQMAMSFSVHGCKVSVISWCGPNEAVNSPDGRKRLIDSGIPWAHIIGFGNYGSDEGVLIPPGEPRYDYMVGIGKARHMRAIGASTIFDDNRHVCRAVRDSGLLALQVWR